MATKTSDPHGVVAEKGRLNTQITALSAAITAWTGDNNGRIDLVLKNCEASFRVNGLSSAVHTTSSTGPALGPNMLGTSVGSFGLENVSTA